MLTDFQVNQGATFTRLLTIKDDGGAPINLTGYVFGAVGRKKIGDANPAPINFTFQMRDQNTYPGEIYMMLASTALVFLKLKVPTKYLYDCQMTDQAANVTRILEGTITVSPEVTT